MTATLKARVVTATITARAFAFLASAQDNRGPTAKRSPWSGLPTPSPHPLIGLVALCLLSCPARLSTRRTSVPKSPRYSPLDFRP